MKKILVVEDVIEVFHAIAKRYKDVAVVLCAQWVARAEEIFVENPDIDIIIMDACVPGRNPNTIPLVRKMRETFKGSMIAFSGEKEFDDMLVEAGCDHRLSERKSLYALIKELDELLR